MCAACRHWGGGGREDLRDGILTLPAALAIAIADDTGRAACCRAEPGEDDLELTAAAFLAALPEAEGRRARPSISRSSHGTPSRSSRSWRTRGN